MAGSPNDCKVGPTVNAIQCRFSGRPGTVCGTSPKRAFSLVLSATSAGDLPGLQSHASNSFLVSRCWVLGTRGSTTNSCSPSGSYFTCSQRRKRSIASPTALYNVRASNSTACSMPSESLNATRHTFTRAAYHIRFLFATVLTLPDQLPAASCLAQAHKSGVSQVAVRGPFDKLELTHQRWLQPQCRMPVYAASAVASVVISAFSAVSFRHNQLRMRQRNRASFAHVSKRYATDRSLLLSGKRLEAGGGTFVGAVSISRTVVLTAVRISRSVNGASRSTATAGRRESRSPWGR